MNTHACKKACDDCADQKKRPIINDINALKCYNGSKQLSGIMKNGADNACKPNELATQQTVGKCHGDQAENAAKEAEKERHHLPGKDAGKKNAHQQNDGSLFGHAVDNQQQCDDIGKAKLDAGNRYDRRYGRFNDKDDQSNGCK